MTDAERRELVKQAKAIVEQSRLSDSDKKLLSGRLPFVADMLLQMFVEVCNEDPFGIDLLIMNLKKKLDAQGNLSKIHEIIKQERREVEDLISAKN